MDSDIPQFVLFRAVRSLPDVPKRIYLLAYRGHEVKEIARLTDLPAAEVEQWLAVARAFVRQISL